MSWFNYYGLIFVIVLLLPNILFAIKTKGKFESKYKNKWLEIAENFGRFGCMIFMIFNIPYTYFGFWFASAEIVYLCVNSVLCASYLLCWLIFKQNNLSRALTLSILPSLIFLFSAIVISNIPLAFFATLFAITHIYISCKNVINSK